MIKALIPSFLLLVAVITFFALVPAQVKKPEVKNLLLITIDTVRADTFFAPEDNQFTDALTPWLKRARVYRQAQAVSPWTIPSIATVLTGYAPNQHGAGAFSKPIANLNKDLPSSLLTAVPTIAELLQKLGFNNLAASAHPWFSSGFGLERGFLKVHQMKSRENINAWFRKSLDERKQEEVSQRNFTYLHYMEAHGRHVRSFDENFLDLSDEQVSRNLSWTKLPACTDGVQQEMCQRYITYTQAVIDLRESLANILEMLDSSGLLAETLVVVYSDHGEEFNEHLTQALADNHDPRGVNGFGHGNSLYQEQLLIPLLIWNPNDSGGRVVNTPVSLLDVAPSILDWLGIDSGENNFPGMLLSKAEKQNERVLFASNIAYGPEMIAVREGQLKSIWNTVSDESRYFDLQQDPGEQNPIQNNDLIMRFDVLSGDYLELSDSNIGTTPEISEEQLQHLKSIGYLQGSESTNKPLPTNSLNPELKNTENPKND